MAGGFRAGRDYVLTDGRNTEISVSIVSTFAETYMTDIGSASATVFCEIVAVLLGELVETGVAFKGIFTFLGTVGIHRIKNIPGQITALS